MIKTWVLKAFSHEQVKIIYIDFSFILVNKATRSQKFIGLSDFTPVRSIFTAALSHHSGAPPLLSIFISVGFRPIDLEVRLWVFSRFFSSQACGVSETHLTYFSVRSSDLFCSFSMHLPSESGFWFFRGCLAPSPFHKQSQTVPPAMGNRSCQALVSCVKYLSFIQCFPSSVLQRDGKTFPCITPFQLMFDGV